MTSEGTSGDDLDVRLDWPGADVANSADAATIAPNGAARYSTPSEPPPDSEGSRTDAARVPVHQELELETIRATLALMSARIEALAGAVEGNRLSHHAVAAAIERLEHSVSVLSKASTEAEQQSTAGMRDISKVLAENLEGLTRQIEAIRRRITLRGRPDQYSYEEMIESIAAVVAERLSLERSAVPPAAQGRRRRER